MASFSYCKGCIFWDITRSHTITGACMGQRRRYAPTPCSKDKIFSGEGVWLKTFDNDLFG